jgi:hypothetical protein
MASLTSIAISASCVTIGMYNKQIAGELKMNVGWLHKNGMYFTLFLAFTIFISNMLVRAIDPTIIGTFGIVIALSCIGFGTLYFFRSGLSNLEIRENGIVDFWLFLRWEEIESYDWNGTTVTIRFRRGLAMQSSWYIPMIYKENFEHLLHQHVFPGFQLIQEKYRL